MIFFQPQNKQTQSLLFGWIFIEKGLVWEFMCTSFSSHVVLSEKVLGFHYLRCGDSITRYSKKVEILDLKMKVWKSHMLGVTLFHRIHGICIFTITRWWQLKYVLFSPRKLGKISNLKNIFQMGWFNHQLEMLNWEKTLCFEVLTPSFR